MKEKGRLFDMLKQTPVIAGAVAIVALASYLFSMLLETSLIRLGLNLMKNETTIVITMAALSVISFIICFFILISYMKTVGKNDRLYCEKNEIEPKSPSVKLATKTFALALFMYGAVLLLLNFFHWNFFEGPIFYLSFVFYSIPETLYPDTTAEYVFVWCEILGFIIFAVGFYAAMMIGYIRGYKANTEE